jgi:hypothetical protein
LVRVQQPRRSSPLPPTGCTNTTTNTTHRNRNRSRWGSQCSPHRQVMTAAALVELCTVPATGSVMQCISICYKNTRPLLFTTCTAQVAQVSEGTSPAGRSSTSSTAAPPPPAAAAASGHPASGFMHSLASSAAALTAAGAAMWKQRLPHPAPPCQRARTFLPGRIRPVMNEVRVLPRGGWEITQHCRTHFRDLTVGVCNEERASPHACVCLSMCMHSVPAPAAVLIPLFSTRHIFLLHHHTCCTCAAALRTSSGVPAVWVVARLV